MDKYDINLKQGETLNLPLKFETLKGEAINLSGLTAKAQVRPEAGSQTLTAEMVCTVSVAENTVRLSLDSATTSAITPGVYAWDLALISSEEIKYYVEGAFKVRPHVTEVGA